MRNRINASVVNVVVDRIDRAVVAGICVVRGVLPPLASGASYPRAGACATTPGNKAPGKTGSCHLLGKRLHRLHVLQQMSERMPQSWRSRPRFTTGSQRLASIG